MTDLGIRPEDIRAALDSYIESFTPVDATAEQVGHVTETADGIAQVGPLEVCDSRVQVGVNAFIPGDVLQAVQNHACTPFLQCG